MSLPASPPCADPQAEALTYQDLVALARADFWVFIELTFPVLHPGQQLVFAEYLEVMATLLMRAAEGQRRRIIFNLPPRFMKSMLVSVLYVAWRLGRDPTAKFICISYGDDLAHDLSATTRKLMLSRPYARIFPRPCWTKRRSITSRPPRAGAATPPRWAATSRALEPTRSSSMIRCSPTRPRPSWPSRRCARGCRAPS